jgi:hypothetical protein
LACASCSVSGSRLKVSALIILDSGVRNQSD